MASHVPYLVVRPAAPFSTDAKPSRSSNGIPPPPPTEPAMDGSAPPYRGAPSRLMAASKLPPYLRFPLVCLLVFGLSTLLYSLTADWAGYQLASVSRDLPEPWQVGAVLGWKFVELCTAWYAGYDYVDILALSVLSNTPHYYLLTTYYRIDWWACAAAILIDISALTIPFALLRPTTQFHLSPSQPPTPRTHARTVTRDPYVNGPVSWLGAAIYALTVYASFHTWLPSHLVTHFAGLKVLREPYEHEIWALVKLFALLQPAGWAALQFLFQPALRGKNKLEDALKPITERAFNAEKSSFSQTLAWNLGFGGEGFSRRAEVLTQRTLVLATCTFINTFVRVFGTLAGTELVGSLGWAGVWAGASVLVGLAFAWVGDD